MANFVRQRSTGFWTLGSTFLPGEAEEIDARWPKIPNFTDGGTWSSLTPVILGGAGFQTSHFEATNVDVFQVDGVVTFNNASEVFYAASVAVSVSAGAWTFDDESLVIFDGSSGMQFTDESVMSFLTSTQLTMGTGSTLAMLGTAELTMASTSTMSLAGQITVTSTGGITLNTGGTLVAGSIQIDSTGISHAGGSWATATGLLTMTGRILLSGSDAGIRQRIGTVANTAAVTIDVSKDLWMVPKTLSATQTLTVRHSTSPIPGDGQPLRISRSYSATSACLIKREDGTLLGTLPATGNAVKSCVALIYLASQGGWVVDWTSGDATVDNLGTTYH